MVHRLFPLVLVALACAAPPPPPVVAPDPEPVVETKPVEQPVLGSVTVTASALNVRREPSTDADVIVQAKKGEKLAVLARDESWVKVRLDGGESGWVAARFVSDGSAAKQASKSKKKGCPSDSDFAFTKTPTLAFSDRPAKGLVVVEATVNTKGDVTATKLISNTTGDESLAFLAQREIKEAKFSPPIRNCVPKNFIFTYRRTF